VGRRDDCGLPEHPDLSCAGAAEFHPCQDPLGLPRTHGPMLPGAAVQIANGALSRVEQTKRFAIGQTHIRWILRPNYWHPDAGEGTGLLIALPALRECKHPYCGSDRSTPEKGAAG